MSDSSGSDSFTERSSRNVFQRVGGAIVGVAFGLLLFVVAIGVLLWNESRAVDAIRGLGQAAHDVVEVQPSPVDDTQNGHLVHLSGMLAAHGALSDPDTGLSKTNLVRLKRTVEMYQWKQESESHTDNQIGGGSTTRTIYTYKKVWSEDPIDSSDFKSQDRHENPEMPVRTAVFDNNDVTLGDRKLAPDLVQEMNAFSSAAPPATAPDGYRVEGRRLYKGDDPDKPHIGDIRIGFGEIAAQEVSIMAAQSGTLLAPFRTKNGYQIALVSVGDESAAEMVAQKRAEEQTLTWILRAVGFFCFFFSLLLIAGPLEALANILPFLGSIVGAGIFVFAVGLAIPLTLVTIALAWVVVRPLLGIGLLFAAGVFFVAYHRLRHRRPVPAQTIGR